MPSRTSMILLGPTQPIVVPRPPLSLRTASLSRRDGSLTSGRSAYLTICSGEGGWILSQSLCVETVEACQQGVPFPGRLQWKRQLE